MYVVDIITFLILPTNPSLPLELTPTYKLNTLVLLKGTNEELVVSMSGPLFSLNPMSYKLSFDL